MRSLIICSFFTLLIFVVTHHNAYALSCASRPLTFEIIESHPIIFEGVVIDIKTPDFEMDVNPKAPVKKEFKVHTFQVNTLWYSKAPFAPVVRVVAGPGWASDHAYKKGETALVFARSVVAGQKDTYMASPGWCDYYQNTYNVLQNYKSTHR